MVTVTPDLNNTKVLRSGIEKGLKETHPSGGHTFPKERLGLRELWKNLQNSPKKKNTSLRIKNIIPTFMLSLTKKECLPHLLSLQISMNQYTTLRTISPLIISLMRGPNHLILNHRINLLVRNHKSLDTKKGQIEGRRIW